MRVKSFACASALLLLAAAPAQESRPLSTDSLYAIAEDLKVLASAAPAERVAALRRILADVERAAEADSGPASESRDDSREVARAALTVVADGIPVLGERLRDGDVEPRRLAAMILDRLEGRAQAAVPFLVKALSDDDAVVRDAASGAIARMVPEGDQAVPALVAALASPDKNVRQNVSWALYKMGPRAKAAVPELTRLIADEHRAVRLNAVRAIGRMGDAGGAALGPLLAATRAPEMRGAVAHAVRDMVVAVRAERNAVSAEERRFADLIARKTHLSATLSLIAAAVPVLLTLLDDPDPEAREGAAWALGALDADARTAVPALVAALPGDESTRAALVWAIAKIGPPSADVLPRLVDLLRDSDSEVRQNAAWAIGSLGRAAKPALAALTETVANDRSDVQINAARALAAIGPDARSAVPALLAVSERSGPLLVAVTAALDKIDPASIPFERLRELQASGGEEMAFAAELALADQDSRRAFATSRAAGRSRPGSPAGAMPAEAHQYFAFLSRAVAWGSEADGWWLGTAEVRIEADVLHVDWIAFTKDGDWKLWSKLDGLRIAWTVRAPGLEPMTRTETIAAPAAGNGNGSWWALAGRIPLDALRAHWGGRLPDAMTVEARLADPLLPAAAAAAAEVVPAQPPGAAETRTGK